MTPSRFVSATLILLAAFLPGTAPAQEPASPAALITAQREAMAPLAYMDGVWRGPAWSLTPKGEKHNITQTERIGPFLDGSVKVIEGRGYDDQGKVTFNALGIISYDSDQKTYSMRSYAMGRSGDFPVTTTSDGYIWEIPAGPGMTIRYTAVVKDGKWHEVGDHIMPGKDPLRIFEMSLTRVGDSSWPGAGAISAK
jgi:hypothetical protein